MCAAGGESVRAVGNSEAAPPPGMLPCRLLCLSFVSHTLVPIALSPASTCSHAVPAAAAAIVVVVVGAADGAAATAGSATRCSCYCSRLRWRCASLRSPGRASSWWRSTGCTLRRSGTALRGAWCSGVCAQFLGEECASCIWLRWRFRLPAASACTLPASSEYTASASPR